MGAVYWPAVKVSLTTELKSALVAAGLPCGGDEATLTHDHVMTAVRQDVAQVVEAAVPLFPASDRTMCVTELVKAAAADNSAKCCFKLLDFLEGKAEWEKLVIVALEAAVAHSQNSLCQKLMTKVPERSSTFFQRKMASVLLIYACRYKQSALIEVAVSFRADMREAAGNRTGLVRERTSLHIAAMRGHVDSLQLLLRLMGEKVNLVHVVDSGGRTPLHLAAMNGHETACELLLQYDADPNAADNAQLAPLHLAAMNGSTTVCNMLIGANAYAAPRGLDGVTPATLAAANGHVECIRDALLPNGAALASQFDAEPTSYDQLLLDLVTTTKSLDALAKQELCIALEAPAVVVPFVAAGVALGAACIPSRWWLVSPLFMVCLCLAIVLLGRRLHPPDTNLATLLDRLRTVQTALKSRRAAPDGYTPESFTRLTDTITAFKLDSCSKDDIDSVTAAVNVFLKTDRNSTFLGDTRHPALETSALEGINAISSILDDRNVDRGRLLARRQALHSVLSTAEATPDVLWLQSPFKEWEFYHTRWDRLTLLFVSLLVMITIFTSLSADLFTADGAVAFTFANDLAAACIDTTKLHCSNFSTSDAWLKRTNTDCLFDGLMMVPPRATGQPNHTVLIDSETSRTVGIRSAVRFDASVPPAAIVVVDACALTRPRPKVTIHVLFGQDAAAREATTGPAFLILSGSAMFLAQLAVAFRWARRHRNTYQINGGENFTKSCVRFVLLSSLHACVAAQTIVLGIRRFDGRPLAEMEALSVSVAVLSTYPGLVCITWAPSGYIVAPVLRTAFLGVLFVLGVVGIVPLIPAFESFTIPLFVTDPHRAIVSFDDASAPRTLYVAICVLWLLLGLRFFVAAAGALAPEDARAHYFEFFRESRANVAKGLPKKWYATDGGDRQRPWTKRATGKVQRHVRMHAYQNGPRNVSCITRFTDSDTDDAPPAVTGAAPAPTGGSALNGVSGPPPLPARDATPAHRITANVRAIEALRPRSAPNPLDDSNVYTRVSYADHDGAAIP